MKHLSLSALRSALATLVLLIFLHASAFAAAATGTISADGTAIMPVPGYMITGNANTLYITGTFGSGTITVEASPDGGVNWVAIPNYSWTAAAVANVQFRYSSVRIKMTGSTNPAVTWWLL